MVEAGREAREGEREFHVLYGIKYFFTFGRRFGDVSCLTQDKFTKIFGNG